MVALGVVLLVLRTCLSLDAEKCVETQSGGGTSTERPDVETFAEAMSKTPWSCSDLMEAFLKRAYKDAAGSFHFARRKVPVRKVMDRLEKEKLKSGYGYLLPQEVLDCLESRLNELGSGNQVTMENCRRAAVNSGSKDKIGNLYGLVVPTASRKASFLRWLLP